MLDCWLFQAYGSLWPCWQGRLLEAMLPRPNVSLARYLSELKLEAVTITSSLLCTKTGIFRQPGDFSRRCSSFRVS